MHRQTSDFPDITANGGTVFFVSNDDLGGQNPGRSQQVWRINSDKTGLQRLTNFDPAKQVTIKSVTVSGDGTKLSLTAQPNRNGSAAPDVCYQLWSLNGDGTGLTMLTPHASDTEMAAISRNGTLIAYSSWAAPDGVEAEWASSDIFVRKPDGTGFTRLTATPAPPLGSERSSHAPRTDTTGTWVVFQSVGNFTGLNPDGSFEIYRVKSDGTGMQQISNGSGVLESEHPDISGDSRWIVYDSQTNPVGTNSDTSREIFAYDTQTSTTKQLTNTNGDNHDPRISEDGQWVFFSSSAFIFESDPDFPTQAYRVRVSDGLLQRFTGLLVGGQTFFVQSPIGVSDNGNAATLRIFGDATLENPDLNEEIYFGDVTALNVPSISKTSPTSFSFAPEPAPIRYDMIRGNVADLGPGGGGTVNLGLVFCLDNDSPDTSITGHEDTLTPAPGPSFFYLYRGSQGLISGPGSYGSSSSGLDRKPNSGDCLN